MMIRIIVSDTSFNRFCKELIERKEEYPNAKVKSTYTEDATKAEDAFMFCCILEVENSE